MHGRQHKSRIIQVIARCSMQLHLLDFGQSDERVVHKMCTMQSIYKLKRVVFSVLSILCILSANALMHVVVVAC